MSTQDITGLREQILANGRFMLQTEIQPHLTLSTTTLITEPDPLQIIVFGGGNKIRGALMLRARPAIEGGEASTPEAALRKLLLATTEIMSQYVPKMGGHQRVIHGGGVFDEDFIAVDLREQRKSM